MSPEKLVNDFDYNGIDFPVSKKIIARLNKKNKIFIHVFCYEFKLTCPVYVSNEKCENCKNLLTITEINKSHYVYIKDFNRFMCSKTNTFENIIYNVLVMKIALQQHKIIA